MSYSDTVKKSSQLPNFRPKQTNDLPPPTSHATRTTRLLVSFAAVLLVVASAGFGMLFAWNVGSQHDNELLGALSVAMALGLELSKPFSIASAFAQLRQFRIVTAAALTLVGILAIGYSLQAELTFMSMTRGDLVAERAGERDATQRAAERYDRLQAELTALKPASSKERDVDAYLARRNALQADLRQAEMDRREAPAVAAPDPGAVALATYAGALGLKADPQQLGLWLPLVGVLALELGAAFSVVLVRSVAQTSIGPATSPANEGVPAVQRESVDQGVGPVQRAVRPKRRDRRPPDDGPQAGPPARGLTATLKVLQGGAVQGSQRAIAQAIGSSKTTVQRALRLLAEPSFAAA